MKFDVKLITILFVVLQKYDCARICFSCTDMTENEKCQHAVSCNDNEVCFVQKYRNLRNETLYDVGCTHPERCLHVTGSIIGKRNDQSHVLCQRCCNDTQVCNTDTTCNYNKASSKICFSCTNMAENEKCTHTTNCEENEVCFVQKYQTTGNITRYDVGCTFPELCRKDSNMFGKRSDHSHIVCQKCCDENVCNINPTCELRVPLQKCLSCSEVEDPNVCKNISTCGQNEVCYLHKYTTELNHQQFDMGCKHSTLCLHGYTSVFGRRLLVGRHLTCESCCSGSDLCNKNLQCRHDQLKTENSSCTSTIDCYSNLVCLFGQCGCLSDYFWDNNKCIKKKSVSELCNENNQCQESLQCIFNTCECPDMLYWNGSFCTSRPIECEDLSAVKDGIYLIYPTTGLPVLVYCMIEGNKKWTVIQRRFSEYNNFYRTWDEYKTGFGNPYGEYWLGNENIHQISTNGHHEISIYLEDVFSNYRFANYSTFSVGNEASKYILNITGYSGDAGDSMDKLYSPSGANGQMFSTRDQDNDKNSFTNLAKYQESGWWYSDKAYSDLNQKYMNWESFQIRLIKSVLKIRRK